MPRKPAWSTFSRWSWFAVVGALLGARDMCGGGGHPPDPPADAAPDAPADGSMSLRTPPPAPPAAAARKG